MSYRDEPDDRRDIVAGQHRPAGGLVTAKDGIRGVRFRRLERIEDRCCLQLVRRADSLTLEVVIPLHVVANEGCRHNDRKAGEQDEDRGRLFPRSYEFRHTGPGQDL